MSPRRQRVRERQRFPGRPDQVAAARRLVSALLGHDGPGQEVARLLVSEAATNALLHSASGRHGGGFEVRFELADRRSLRVEVRDEGAATEPRRRPHHPDALTGRGLELFDALATRWGATGGPGGHTVWFELQLG